MKADLTIFIASYKYGHLVAHAVETILAQSFQPSRIVVLDDGIGDCRHIPELYPSVELIERKKNLGTDRNFHSALLTSKTKRTMFLGADNWLREDAVEVLMNSTVNSAIVTYDIAVVGNLAEWWSEKYPMSREAGYYRWNLAQGGDSSLIAQKNFLHGSSMYDTKLAIQAGGYLGGYGQESPEDWRLWKRMINNGAMWVRVPEALLFYRRHNHNFLQYDSKL